jgi:hypothetical protein
VDCSGKINRFSPRKLGRTSWAAAAVAVAEATIIAILAGPTLVDTQVRAAEVVAVVVGVEATVLIQGI